MRKATKTFISFAVILIAGLNFIVPAFAQDPFSIAIGGLTGLSGAGLFGSMASMSGINIEYVSDPVNDAMWNDLNPDSVYLQGIKHEASGQGDDLWDYITVDIGDWLNAQSDFIVNFAQEYEVTDNSSGTTKNERSFDGVPLTIEHNNSWLSATIDSAVIDSSKIADYYFGNSKFAVNFSYYQANYCNITWYYNGNVVNIDQNVYYKRINIPFDLRLRSLSNGTVSIAVFQNGSLTASRNSNALGSATVDSGLSWTSNDVNLDVYNGWNAAKVKIPKNLGVLPVSWDIPDFVDAVNDLWEDNLQGNIVIEDTDQPVPPPPLPTTPLGETPFDDWVDLWGQGIYQQLENQTEALDLIGSNGEDQVEELESIDSNLGELNQTAESIDTNIGIGNGILGGIRSLAQSAVNFLEGIAEHVEELVEEIVEGTETLIAGILNQIPQAFGVIFGPIKQASSIWHYVVEWILSIGAPFQFIWSMASGTSYYIILPVYASLAAAVVLAFYKRFGK